MSTERVMNVMLHLAPAGMLASTWSSVLTGGTLGMFDMLTQVVSLSAMFVIVRIREAEVARHFAEALAGNEHHFLKGGDLQWSRELIEELGKSRNSILAVSGVTEHMVGGDGALGRPWRAVKSFVKAEPESAGYTVRGNGP